MGRLATRGQRLRRTLSALDETHMVQIADWIERVLRAPSDDAVRSAVRAEVSSLCAAFAPYAR